MKFSFWLIWKFCNEKTFASVTISSTHKILPKEGGSVNRHVVRADLQPSLQVDNQHVSIFLQFCNQPGFHPAWCSRRSRRDNGMWACCTWPPRTTARAPCGPSPPVPPSWNRKRSFAGRAQARRGPSGSGGRSWTSVENGSTRAWRKVRTTNEW